jgi:AcrR family transcriptional regulator
VTIRKIADRIEYSPPMIYEHFENKDAILLELMREGFRLLLAEIKTTNATTGAPTTRVMRIAVAYWEFAWKYPELYQVMHGLGGVPFCADDTLTGSSGPPAEAQAVFEATEQAVRTLPHLAQATEEDLEDAVHIIWATLHGLVSLTMAGRIKGGQQHAMRLVKRAVRDFLAARR